MEIGNLKISLAETKLEQKKGGLGRPSHSVDRDGEINNQKADEEPLSKFSQNIQFFWLDKGQ